MSALAADFRIKVLDSGLCLDFVLSEALLGLGPIGNTMQVATIGPNADNYEVLPQLRAWSAVSRFAQLSATATVPVATSWAKHRRIHLLVPYQFRVSCRLRVHQTTAAICVLSSRRGVSGSHAQGRRVSARSPCFSPLLDPGACPKALTWQRVHCKGHCASIPKSHPKTIKTTGIHRQAWDDLASQV